MIVRDKILQSEYSFFLNCFSSKDVELVIADLQRLKRGYKNLYILDTYDIVENYLPYTDIELFTKKDINSQAQKFICYDYFFGGFNDTSSILLNEYKIELLAAKNKLSKHLREAKNLLNHFDELKKETMGSLTNNGKMEVFFQNNFEVILLLLILNDKTSYILYEFFDFIKNRLQISEVKSESISDFDLLNTIFSQSQYTSFSVEVFERYINENRLKLLSVDRFEDRHIFLENTFRDIQVIERVKRINDQFNKKELKYFAIYLSTANKTNDIIKIVESLDNNKSHYHNDFHRNIYQFFLFDRIKVEYEKDLDKGIDLLETLQTILQKFSKKSKNVVLEDPSAKDVLDIVKSLFDEKSGTIDNHFYLSVYEKYKTTFNRLKDNSYQNNGDNNELLSIIDQIEQNKKKYDLDNLLSLDLSLSQLVQTYDIVETFKNFDNYDPQYRKGKDVISNPYQHLPVLLLINAKFGNELQVKLHRFLNNKVEEQNINLTLLKQYLHDVVCELPKLDNSDQSARILKSLLTTYINVVAQSKENDSTSTDYSKFNSEEGFIIDLEKQYEIAKFYSQKVDYKKSVKAGKVEYLFHEGLLEYEIVYILIWLYRRNKRPDEGIKIGLDIIQKSERDPRIYQGIALCYISKLYDGISMGHESGENIFNLDSAIQYLEKARALFIDLINITLDVNLCSLIVKNYISVLNSLSDLFIRKFEMSGSVNHDLINQARGYIDIEKSMFKRIGLEFDNYPILSSTEIEVEYYEALIFTKNNETGRAHGKLINALSKVSTLSKVPNAENFYKGIFTHVKTNLNKLALEIFAKYS